jgi:hypothetical protein
MLYFIRTRGEVRRPDRGTVLMVAEALELWGYEAAHRAETGDRQARRDSQVYANCARRVRAIAEWSDDNQRLDIADRQVLRAMSQSVRHHG